MEQTADHKMDLTASRKPKKAIGLRAVEERRLVEEAHKKTNLAFSELVRRCVRKAIAEVTAEAQAELGTTRSASRRPPKRGLNGFE